GGAGWGAGGGAGWGGTCPAGEPFRDYQAFAAAVRGHAPAPAEVVLFRAEAHALAFRLGRPVAVLADWGELRARLARPGAHHVVLPPAVAEEARRALHGLLLEELGRNTDLSGGAHERPLVHLRVARPVVQREEPTGKRHALATAAAADQHRTAQRGTAGPQRRRPPGAGGGGLGRAPRRAGARLRIAAGG